MTGYKSFARDPTAACPVGVGLAVWVLLAACVPGLAQPSNARDLASLSLEELMNLKVTSVSAKEQKLSRTAAAVYVITAEDIRRSGAATIPDLLRIVPGVDVRQINANTWAIGIRGFTDRFSNKVLVLIDGRSVYNAAYSGVLWDIEGTPLEDIDRIEVIRGPGGTVWGANAMNGVINIITKDAAATQGGLVAAGAGSELRASTTVRYGSSIGRKGKYRVFGRYFDVGPAARIGGGPGEDTWHVFQGGFRSDWQLSPADGLTIQGSLLRSRESQLIDTIFSAALPQQRTLADRVESTRGDVLGRWTHIHRKGSESAVQIYYDGLDRLSAGVPYSLHTVDLDFRQHVVTPSRHDVVWGAGVRITASRFGAGYSLTMNPPRQTDRLFSSFIQDEIRLTPSLRFTIGSKFEHNNYTGFEWEPSAQLLWEATRRHAAWVSAARAVRQPSRVDAGVNWEMSLVSVAGLPFGVVVANGNPRLRAEHVNDFEAGYRALLNPRLSVDAAGFTSYYRDLVTGDRQPPYLAATGPPHLVIPIVFGNGAEAHSYGAELFLNWRPMGRLRLSGGYSALQVNAAVKASSPRSVLTQAPDTSSRNLWQLRCFVDLPHHFEWDQTFAYSSGLRPGEIPPHTRWDSRFGWSFGESLVLSITAQNLLQPRHSEFPDEYGLNHTQTERGVFGKIVWRF